MTTGICTRTAHASSAAGDLVYLRSVKSGSTVTKVYGYVFSNPQERIGLLQFGGLPSSPISGAAVELESAGGTRTTTTDARGAFSFEDLPEGNYEVHASAKSYSIERFRHSFHLARYACSLQYLMVQPLK